MVSTRHSMGASEQLVSLETATPIRFTNRSPSPKKRRLEDEDSPEQNFVDARATPFAKRQRTPPSDSSPLRRNTSNINEEHKKRASDGVDEDEGDSDDEAPEAVSNVNAAQSAKLEANARTGTLKKQADEAREQRRKRDEVLRAQKESRRHIDNPEIVPATLPESDGLEETIEDENDQDETTMITGKSRRAPIPRLLPDDILNAPQAVTEQNESTNGLSQTAPKHTKFEVKKEITTLKKGPLTVQLLKRKRNDMAPRQTASVANTKNQWLYQRGQHSDNRRVVKKPLA